MTFRPADESAQLSHVREDLQREFPDLDRAMVGALLDQVRAAFDEAPIRTFVPVLVRRGARERLRTLG